MAGYGSPGNPNMLPGPGRPKGLKNSKTGTRELITLMGELNHDAVVDQIAMIREPNCPYSIRYKVNADFIKLIYPQVKAVEHSGSIEHRSLNVNMTVQEPTPISVIESVDESVTTDVITNDSDDIQS